MKTHNKNTLACVLTVFLFALSLGGIGLKTALAAADVWDGSTASAFAEGNGTSASPYQIATGAQLAYLASVVNGDANGLPSVGVYYVLTADIDLNHLPWTPIATTYFRGVFDGDGHVITNLSIGTVAVPDTSGKVLGLFGTIAGGTVKNLGIENIAIYASASSRTGGVAGSFSSWGTPMTPSTIFNCYTSGVIVNSRAGTSAAYAGGLAGSCAGVSEDESLRNLVINCGSTVNVTASGTATSVRTGGLIGLTSLANIRNCYATGDVVSGNVDKTGGMIGDNQSANVTNCY